MDTDRSNHEIRFPKARLESAKCRSGLRLGRIATQSKDLYQVITQDATRLAKLSGVRRHQAMGGRDYPAVGDYVLIDDDPQAEHVVIHEILERTSAFVRKAPGRTQEVQVVAANIDTVFLCMAMGRDFNLRRLERYLAIAWESNAMPVVVLTKADLCENPEERLAQAQQAAVGTEVLVTSGLDGAGLDALGPHLQPGRTVAFLGSSGVGKSTLINRILGETVQQTHDVRADGKGRHTTTRRELICTLSGAALIDTPGMREIGAEGVDLAKSFPDIDELAAHCRFRDCSHTSEPGCAVRQAIEAGTLAQERLDSYRKLKREARYDGMDAKQIETEKTNAMFAEFGGRKNAKRYIRNRKRRS